MAEKTAAQKRAQMKYMEKFAVTKVRMTPEKMQTTKAHAAAHGESLSGFINRAISETISRDSQREGES